MSFYVFMKFLEKTPGRYDFAIRLLSSGKLNDVYKRFVSYIEPGQKVLDIGCGTGTLAIMAALKGAKVRGIDINPRMLEIAREKAEKSGVSQNVEFIEMGVGELYTEGENSYDVIVSVLCFSELSEQEQDFALSMIKKILKPGGLLLIADETVPTGFFKRILIFKLRLFFKILTFILARSFTRPVKNLPEKIKKYGFEIESIRKNKMGNFLEVVAKNGP